MIRIKKFHTKIMGKKLRGVIYALVFLVMVGLTFSGGVIVEKLRRESNLSTLLHLNLSTSTNETRLNRELATNLPYDQGTSEKLWKTYYNEKFGLSFEIPEESFVLPADRYGGLYQINLPDHPTVKIGLTAMFYISKPDQEFSDAWYKRTLTVDNMKAFQALIPVFGTETQQPRSLSLITRFGSIVDNRLFILTLDGVIKANSRNDAFANLISQQKTYQHILNTFSCCKITKQTLNNQQYGYSLIVPSGWEISDDGSGKYISINSPGPDGSTISLGMNSKGSYVWDDKIIYPHNSATLPPSEKTTITLAGRNYDLFVYTNKDGHLLQQVELFTPNGDNLLISMSDYSQKGLLINHMQDIVKTVTFTAKQ